MISTTGEFHINQAEPVAEPSLNEYYKFIIGQKYHVLIHIYYNEDLKYYFYQLKIDDSTIKNVQVANPREYNNVILYASDPWQTSFTEDFGKVENFKVENN